MSNSLSRGTVQSETANLPNLLLGELGSAVPFSSCRSSAYVTIMVIDRDRSRFEMGRPNAGFGPSITYMHDVGRVHGGCPKLQYVGNDMSRTKAATK